MLLWKLRKVGTICISFDINEDLTSIIMFTVHLLTLLLRHSAYHIPSSVQFDYYVYFVIFSKFTKLYDRHY